MHREFDILTELMIQLERRLFFCAPKYQWIRRDAVKNEESKRKRKVLERKSRYKLDDEEIENVGIS